jgi:hypothetical protein
MRRKHKGLAAIGLSVLALASHAAMVNGTGNVTPNAIFGSGNANGSYTGETDNNIEVGLRAKQRFPAANVFNYDGVDRYVFDSAVLNTNPANRSVFNFEWSVNVDQSGTSGAMLSGFGYRFSFDTDPTAGVAFTTIDPFNTAGYFDHSFGSNATPNGAGTEFASLALMQAELGNYSVAQQSTNLGFGFSTDPDLPGLYSFKFEVFDLSAPTRTLSSAQILVEVSPVPGTVPTPATLPLVIGAMGLLGYASRRRRQ